MKGTGKRKSKGSFLLRCQRNERGKENMKKIIKEQKKDGRSKERKLII